MLALPLVASCGPATPEEAAGEIAELESKIDGLEGDVAAKDAEVSDLEDEIATLRAPAEVYEWRLQSYTTGGPEKETFFSHFLPDVEELSQGQIKITRYDPGVLVPTADVVGAVQTGTLDMASTSFGYHSGLIGPGAELLSGAPFMWKTYNEWATLWYDLGLEDIARELYARHGAHLIGSVLDVPGTNVFSTVPIETMADFSGMKIRTYGMQAALLEKLGAGTIYFPTEETYTALATGLVDAATSGSPSYVIDLAYQEVAKYWVEPTFLQLVDDILICPDVWEELPAHLQRSLELACLDWSCARARMYQYRDAEALATMVEDYGVVVNRLPEADVATIRELSIGLWDEVAGDDPDALEVIRITRDYLKHLGH